MHNPHSTVSLKNPLTHHVWRCPQVKQTLLVWFWSLFPEWLDTFFSFTIIHQIFKYLQFIQRKIKYQAAQFRIMNKTQNFRKSNLVTWTRNTKFSPHFLLLYKHENYSWCIFSWTSYTPKLLSPNFASKMFHTHTYLPLEPKSRR